MRQFLNKKKEVIELVAISFLSLFLELALIRFINSNVKIVSYFNNLLLLSAFLGLGFGSILAAKKYDWFRVFPLNFALIIIIITVLGRLGHKADLSQIIVGGIEVNSTSNLPVYFTDLPAHFVIVLVFCCNFLFFVPLGYRLGKSLNRFENRLVAYAFDLIGSILGVVSFSLLSYLHTSPAIWFSISGFVTLFLLGKNSKTVFYATFILVGIIATALHNEGKWSPYYKVYWESYEHYDEGSKKFLGYMIFADKLRIQDALRFSDALVNQPVLNRWIPYYRLPYHFRKPNKVLILGGGSGNDATMALQCGAERVDVVEIDPVILSLGFYMHPHKPYLDPRIRTINDDARSFLKKNNEKYDLIIINALDSHQQVAGLSTLRLESFMYTVEAFKDVRKHMDEQSIFLVHVISHREWIGKRLYWTLAAAFGKEPRLFTTPKSPFASTALVFGPDEALNNDRFPEIEELIQPDPVPFQKAKNSTVLSTDDWPHLYLAKPQVPNIYIYVLAIVMILTIFAFLIVGEISRIGSYLNLFFLGAGFMLLETRSITSIALFFGSTWVVNAIIIGAILVVIFIGNALILYNIRIPIKLCYLGLFITLALGYLVSPHFLLGYPFSLRVLLTAIWFGMPIFFASLIFSLFFRNVRNTASAFGTNLLGVVVGGVFEYSSMILGLNSLYLLAILLYAFAMLSGLKPKLS